jgi:SAM-dependent methyltransferase
LGDYAKEGVRFIIMAELLCEAVDLRSGSRVLDVATGTGNAALAAARRFCEVSAIDYVAALLEEGRKRAGAEGLEVDFGEGAAENIPFQDASFEAVLSTIGVMFAPDQEKAAGELLRVCRSGGKIGLASWTPDSFVGALFKTLGKHLPPPPPGLKPPLLWGTENRLRELFGDSVSSLRATRRVFVFRFPSPRFFLEHSRRYSGPLVKALEALDAAGQEGLLRDIEETAHNFNRSGDETMVVPSNYLQVVATKR